MEKKEVVTISLIMFICLLVIVIGTSIYITKRNEKDKEERLTKIKEIPVEATEELAEEEQINTNKEDNTENEANNTEIKVSMPYYKNNVNPSSNIEGYTKLSINQTKAGGGNATLWYPSDWKVSGEIFNSEIKIKNVFFEMELNSEATYDQFIDNAISTIRNNTQFDWACSERDHDNEYSVEEFEVNGYEYKLIKVISTSKYTPHGKTYTYFFPLQKDNMLYALMAYVSEKNYNEENINTIKRIFTSFYIY